MKKEIKAEKNTSNVQQNQGLSKSVLVIWNNVVLVQSHRDNIFMDISLSVS